jgi:hypothetical protein
MPVTAGQAGETIVCTACGGQIAVPRLRDLTQLPTATPAAEKAASIGWDTARGFMLAGGLIAVLGTILATSLVWIGGRFFDQPASVATIRSAVQSVPVGELHAAWKTFATTGVRRPPTEQELRLQQFVKTSSGIATVGWGLACIGAVVAVAGGLLFASAGRRAQGPA